MSDRNTIESEVRARAARDPEFRERLIADVRGTISAEYGVEIPAGVSVEIIEETSTRYVLALPPVQDPSAPIPEGELAAVAGGGSYGCPPSTNTTCAPHASQCCSGC